MCILSVEWNQLFYRLSAFQEFQRLGCILQDAQLYVGNKCSITSTKHMRNNRVNNCRVEVK